MSAPSQQQLNTLITHYNRGELQVAIEQANALVAQYPSAIMLYNILGAAHSRLGRHAKALESFSKAVKLNPNFPDAHNNQGATLRNLGRQEEAIASYQEALRLKPDYAEAHYNLGNALGDLQRQEEAIAHYKKAIELKPGYFDAHNNLGLILNSLGQHEEASFSLSKAVSLNPNNPSALNNLGVSLRGLGRQEEAIEKYRQALAIKSDYADAHYNLGNANSDLGKANDAVESYAAALRFNPNLAEAFRSLGSIKRFDAGDPHREQMLRLLGNANTSDNDKMHLNFALGKASEDLDEVEQAFDFYRRGNALRKQVFGYDFSEDQALFDNIKKNFEQHPSMPGFDASSDPLAPAPIFIVGMPRSGTTLVEQILASHSKVRGAGELLALGQAIQSAGWTEAAISAEQIAAIKQSYMSFLSGLGAQEPYITDKAPLNFRWVGYIRCAFPNARIIHVNRDPIATCWSIFKHYFSSIGNGYAYDMRDVAAYYNLYLGLMAFWRDLYPNDIYDIRYERLTENQEAETRKLLSHLDLEFEMETLDFHKTKRAVATSSATQVRKKMYQGSSEEWRKYEEFLAPMIEALRAAQ